MKFLDQPRGLTRFSWRLTAGLWALVLLALALAFTVAPGAISPAIGIGVVAILMTVLSSTVLNVD